MQTQYLRSSAILLVFILVPAICHGQQLAEGGAPGVLVRIYDIQESMRQLPDLVSGQLPNAVKVVPTLDLDGPRGDFDPFKDRFMTEVTGFIDITEAGKYTFRLLSDDGARLWINGRLVIDHDGLHGPAPKDGVIELSAGQHPLRVLHFDAGGGERLALLWKPPGAKEQADFVLIPPSVLTHNASASRETTPGKKRIIPPLRRGRPGDGTPVAGTHPSFDHQLLVTPMIGLQAVPVECSRLNIQTTPSQQDEASLILLPPGDSRGGAVCYAFLSDLRDPGRQQTSSDGYARIDPCAVAYVVADRTHDLQRVVPDDVDGFLQGCAFRFAAGLPEKIVALHSAIPSAIVAWFDVSRQDASTHRQTLCFMRPNERVTFEMYAVRAMTSGFEIEFTKPLDPRVGWDSESYYVEQWPFSLPGTEPGASATGRPPTRDGVRYPVKSASVSADRRKVFLELDDLKTSHVVYIRLLPPCVSEDGELPWSTEAWYTLNAIPKDRYGKVLSPPTKEPQNMLTEEQRQAGWKLLFDGKTTEGWRGFKKDSFPHQGWKAIDGCLVRVGPGGDICTEEEFDDFELELEWRISAGGNSGIFFRASEKFRWPWETAPEMQVLDNAEHADGRNPKTSAAANYALHAPIRDVTEPVGLFNRVRILADGNHIEYWLNGVKVVEYEIASPAWEKIVADSKFKSMPNYGRTNTGRIVLQDHGDRVWYRNIKIRPLGNE